MNKLLLIDGNSIMNRAFYGIPDMTTNDGRHTNAIYGFLKYNLEGNRGRTGNTYLCCF